MVYIAQYDENQKVNGFIGEDKRYYPLVYKTELEAIGTIEYKTQEELDSLSAEQLIKDKWDDLGILLSGLTITTTAGNKFDVSTIGLSNITQRVNTMTDADTDTWYEDWANFTVDKVELQEALVKQAEAKKAKIAELFGGV